MPFSWRPAFVYARPEVATPHSAVGQAAVAKPVPHALAHVRHAREARRLPRDGAGGRAQAQRLRSRGHFYQFDHYYEYHYHKHQYQHQQHYQLQLQLVYQFELN